MKISNKINECSSEIYCNFTIAIYDIYNVPVDIVVQTKTIINHPRDKKLSVLLWTNSSHCKWINWTYQQYPNSPRFPFSNFHHHNPEDYREVYSENCKLSWAGRQAVLLTFTGWLSCNAINEYIIRNIYLWVMFKQGSLLFYFFALIFFLFYRKEGT